MPTNHTDAVLAHGAWADGSSWCKVIGPLEAEGTNVVAAPLPLTSLADGVAASRPGEFPLPTCGGPPASPAACSRSWMATSRSPRPPAARRGGVTKQRRPSQRSCRHLRAGVQARSPVPASSSAQNIQLSAAPMAYLTSLSVYRSAAGQPAGCRGCGSLRRCGQPYLDSGQMVVFGPILDDTGSWV